MATLPPCTNRSIIFARWHQSALSSNTLFLWSTQAGVQVEGRSTVEDRRLRNSYHRVCYVMARCCLCLVSSSTREQACLTLRTGCFISSGRTHGTSLATNSRMRMSSSLPRSTFCTSTVKVVQHFSALLSHTHTHK